MRSLNFLVITGFMVALKVFNLFAAESVHLKPGPYLLLDDHLIEKSSGITRTLNSPKRDLSQPIVTGREDQNFQPYISVVRDTATGRFRMWYGALVKERTRFVSRIVLR